MNEEHLKQIERTVATAIELHVNGKIRNMDKKLDDYIKSDMAWKEESDPYIKGLANITGGAKILVWFAGSVGAIGGAILSIRQFLK